MSLERGVLVFGLGRKLPSGELGLFEKVFRLGFMRGYTACNAGHRDAGGWPLTRQHVEWDGSQETCGQKCTSLRSRGSCSNG